MKISIQQTLLAHLAGRVAGALKMTGTDEMSQYVSLEAGKEGLCLSVSRQDMVATARVSSSAVDEDLLKIYSEGKVFITGEKLVKALVRRSQDALIDLDFKPSDGTEDNSTGVLVARIPGQRKVVFKFLCANMSLSPSCDKCSDKFVIVGGKDLQAYVRQVGIAVGKANYDVKYSNLSIKSSSSVAMAATNSQQLALAEFTPNEHSKDDFEALVPYETVMSASKAWDAEEPVTIRRIDGNMGKLLFLQTIKFGEKPVGMATFCIPCTSKEFVDYEAAIKEPDFSRRCRIKTSELRAVCEDLDVFKGVRTHMVYDPGQRKITFTKKDDGEVNTELALLACEGEGLSLDISSRHLLVAANQCDEDETWIRMSGRQGLLVIGLSQVVRMYFAPFGA